MADLDFRIFDGDNHYYEAEDAFTRHLDRRMRSRCMQWAVVNGRKSLLVAGKVNRFIPNPTFDPVAVPGCLDQYYRGHNPGKKSIKEAFGDLEPIRVEYRDRDARLKVMDAQGIEKAFFFPTLGVGMEEALKHDTPAVHAAFEAFNRWLEDDWGYAYQERIFATPYITLQDRDRGIAELERVLANDARVILMRPAPIFGDAGHRSPADPYFDPFWARVNEAGVTVLYHGGDSGYSKYLADWGEGADAVQAFKASPLQALTMGTRAPFDLMAALVSHRLFSRFPNLRVASIEMGSNWVPWLFQSFRRIFGQEPASFDEDPAETFRRHVWISPFHEDDVPLLRDLIGADRMIMGSDYPHAEGLADPTDYVHELGGFTPADQRKILRDNADFLAVPRPASRA
ncbi:MAG: amidohydrolase family protein [Myxococcota bacterium]